MKIAFKIIFPLVLSLVPQLSCLAATMATNPGSPHVLECPMDSDEALVAKLIEAMSNDDELVRRQAIQKLRELRYSVREELQRKICWAFVQRLLHDDSYWVIQFVVDALSVRDSVTRACMTDQTTVEALIAGLSRGLYWAADDGVLKILFHAADVNNTRAIDVLLQNASRESARASLLWATTNSSKAYDVVTNGGRSSVADCISTFSDPMRDSRIVITFLETAVEEGRRDAVVAAFRVFMKKEKSSVYLNASDSYEAMILRNAVMAGNMTVIDYLIIQMGSSEDPLFRREAAKLLTYAKSSEKQDIRDEVVGLLQDDTVDNEVRTIIARSFIDTPDFNDESITEAFMCALYSDSSKLRKVSEKYLLNLLKRGDAAVADAFIGVWKEYKRFLRKKEWGNACSAIYSALAKDQGVSEMKKDMWVKRVIGCKTQEKLRKSLAKRSLRLARKKHPLSRLALGLGIKSGKKRAGGAGAGAGVS